MVLARNESQYTLEINPQKVGNLDAVINELAKVVEIQARDRSRFRKLRSEVKGADSLPIRTRLTDDEVARFAANAYRFPGVEIKARLFRHYPLGEVASHALGYIGRISDKDLERLDADGVQANYKGSDFIGKAGIEASYERELHGTTGSAQVEIDAGGTRDPHARILAADLGQQPRADARHQAPGGRRARVRQLPRRAGRDRAGDRAACSRSSPSRGTTPTSSSTASTPQPGRRSTTIPTSRSTTAR